jgi:hypothetical protein
MTVNNGLRIHIQVFSVYQDISTALGQVAAQGSAIGLGSALQAGRSRVHFPMVSLTKSLRQHYGPGVGSTSNRNEYQEYFLGGKGGRCVGLTTLTPSCAECLQIWEPQLPATLRACPGP